MKQLLSPKQVAASVGVSESSLKRWCDQGHIPIEKTPGGHRRIHVRDAIQFIRQRGDRLADPTQLGLPAGIESPASGRIEDQVAPLVGALDRGDTDTARRIVFSCYFNGSSLATVCDQLLTPSMHQLGHDWQCGRLEIFQERRACELINQLLFELRGVAPRPAQEGPVAIGGTPEGDHYRLATLMVTLALTEIGWQATSLGTSLPLETLATAANRQQPHLLWLSVSNCEDQDALKQDLATLASRLPAPTRMVIGGQGLSAEIAGRIDRLDYCTSLQALQKLAGTPPGSACSSLADS